MSQFTRKTDISNKKNVEGGCW